MPGRFHRGVLTGLFQKKYLTFHRGTTFMRLFTKSLLAAAVLAAVPMLANAESDFTTGNGAVTADAQLDFRVSIPKILFLQVGTGANVTDVATVDLIDFVVPAANVGNGAPVAATAASGDLGNGAVTAKVLGNSGDITFTSTTAGALGNGAGDTISYGQIAAAVTNLVSAVPLPHPTLVDGATTTVTLSPASGKIVNRDARWTFSYLNNNAVASGTYGGVNTNNGRVTYTASMP